MILRTAPKTFLTFLISAIFLSSTFAQEKYPQTPDELFRAFANAFLARDLDTVKKLCVYTENLDLISQLPKFSKVKLAEVQKQLAALPIKWYKPGDQIKIHGANQTVNDVMSNDRRKIATVKLLEMVYPVAVKKMRTGQWKVDPLLMLQSIGKTLDLERKKNRKNFRINLNGELIYLNESEEINFKDKEGKEHKVTLYKNDIQHYKDGRVQFQYHRDMEVYPGKGKNCFVYTLNSDLSPEIHVLIYDKGSNKRIEMTKFINIWIDNYKSKDAIFEKQQLKDTKQEINGKEYPGKIMYVKEQDKVYYNQFYFFEEKGTLMGVFARSKTIDTGLLNQYLSILCESVYPVKGKK